MPKKKTLNHGAQMREKGYEAPNEKIFNPYELPSNEKAMQYLTDIDIQQNCNRYIWENLPNGLTSWLVEQMLYYRGSLAGFEYNGSIYILPYTITKGINIYGLPNTITPISYNGTHTGDEKFIKHLDLPISLFGDENANAKAVLLFDRMPTFTSATNPTSRYILNQFILTQMADILGRIRVNLIVSNKKIFLVVEDEKQKDIVYKELKIAFNNSNPFVVITSPFGDVESPQDNKELMAQELWETFTSYNSLRCEASGIANNGTFEKKERIVTDEMQGDQKQTNLVLDVGLYHRQIFLTKMQELFPNTDISKTTVRINENQEAEEESGEEEKENVNDNV